MGKMLRGFESGATSGVVAGENSLSPPLPRDDPQPTHRPQGGSASGRPDGIRFGTCSPTRPSRREGGRHRVDLAGSALTVDFQPWSAIPDLGARSASPDVASRWSISTRGRPRSTLSTDADDDPGEVMGTPSISNRGDAGDGAAAIWCRATSTAPGGSSRCRPPTTSGPNRVWTGGDAASRRSRSITVDGVSLTVASVLRTRTARRGIRGRVDPRDARSDDFRPCGGDDVNLEADVISKMVVGHVERYLATRTPDIVLDGRVDSDRASRDRSRRLTLDPAVIRDGAAACRSW